MTALGEHAARVCDALICGGPQDDVLRHIARRLRHEKIESTDDALSRFGVLVEIDAIHAGDDLDQLTAAFCRIRDCAWND